MEKMTVTLNTCDGDGNIVDTTTVELTKQQISDIIDWAAESVLAASDIISESPETSSNIAEGPLGRALGELDKALVVAGVIERGEK